MSELPYDKFDDVGNVICQVCGKSYKAITPFHLRTHNQMKLDEYKEKFPDAPLYGETYSIARSNKESVLFKDKEELPKEKIEVEKIVQPIRSHIDFEHVMPDKIKILKYLHKTYHNLENNFTIVKKNVQNIIEYMFITDIADPVRKIIFNFPNSFWHNQDSYEDPFKRKKLESDGWLWIEIKSSNPTIKDLQMEEDKSEKISD